MRRRHRRNMELTNLARKTIENYFKEKEFYPGEKIEKKYGKEKASFVTLTKNNQLRGCIGSLIATQPLWKDIRKNAIDAAFNDPRFEPLKKEELDKIKIEISILSEPKEIKEKNPEKILKKVNSKMGIILKKDQHQATFLPQVWEQLPDKKDFLENLSIKAGLKKDAWKKSEIFYYKVKKIKE